MAGKRVNGRTIEVVGNVARTKPAPKRPSETVYVEVPEERPAHLFEFDADEPGAYMDEALQGVLTDLGAVDEDAHVTVFRLIAEQGARKEVWLYQCHPKEFSIPQLQADFGPGDYRVKVYGKQQGSNYRVVHADKRLSIGEARGAKKAEALSGAPVVTHDNAQVRELSAAVAAPINALVQALGQILPKQRDAMADFRAFAEIMAIMRPPEHAPAPASDPIAMLERTMALITASRAANPIGEDGEVSNNALILSGINVLKDFLIEARDRGQLRSQPAERQLPPPAGTAARPEPMPAPRPAPRPAAPVPAASSPEGDDMGLMMKMQIQLFLTAAKGDSDPQLYAGLIYEQAPDELLDKLAASNWWEELIKLDHRFAPYKAWCEQVRELVVQEMQQPSEDGEPVKLTPQDGGSITATDGAAPRTE